MELNNYQLLYIQTVYDYFRENLQWPTYRQVQRKILPTRRDFRVLDVAKSIEDNPASHFHQNLDDKTAITIKEIHHLPEAQQDLAHLLKLINFSVEKYYTEDKEGVRVTSEEVSQNLHFDETISRKMFLLLGLTMGIMGSNGNSLDYTTWYFEVSDSAIEYESLKTIDDYFKRRDEITKAYEVNRSSRTMVSMMSQYTAPSVYVLKKQIAPEVIEAISDPKIKQICLELNNTPVENVLSLAQGLGEALKWTLWYRAQQVGTSMTVRSMGLSKLLDDAINRPYFSGNATMKFLRDFNGFLKTGYDMVRHDPAYIPDFTVLNPAIDALEHVLKETFPSKS